MNIRCNSKINNVSIIIIIIICSVCKVRAGRPVIRGSVSVCEWVNVTSAQSVDWISAIEKLVLSCISLIDNSEITIKENVNDIYNLIMMISIKCNPKILKCTWVQDVVMLLNDVHTLSINSISFLFLHEQVLYVKARLEKEPWLTSAEKMPQISFLFNNSYAKCCLHRQQKKRVLFCFRNK